MKSKTFIAWVLVAYCCVAIATTGCRMRPRAERSAKQSSEPETAAQPNVPQAELSISANNGEGDDLPVKEEIRRKFKLEPETHINVFNINGNVTVETADTDTAEILVVRSAKKREDLDNYRKVRIEQGRDNRLIISVENDRKSLFSALGSLPEGRQRVVMKIPRKADFETHGISGNLTMGETQGRLQLRNVNGQIKAARISGVSQFADVNGGVEATFAPLNGKGIEAYDINGNVDFHFEGEVNADLNAWDINGRLNPDLPGVQARNEEQGRGRLKARIGAGGAQIRIGQVNGNVNLLKAEKAATTTAKAASK